MNEGGLTGRRRQVEDKIVDRPRARVPLANYTVSSGTERSARNIQRFKIILLLQEECVGTAL
jgi:hypothetical protein